LIRSREVRSASFTGRLLWERAVQRVESCSHQPVRRGSILKCIRDAIRVAELEVGRRVGPMMMVEV